MQARDLRRVLVDNLCAFGLKQSSVRASKLPPMSVKLRPGIRPFKADYRSMGGVLKEAMRVKLEDLLRMKLISRELNPYFSSAAFMVPKRNGSYRMVVDLRKVNEAVELTAANLPSLENQLSWLPQKCKYFGGLEALSGFDMLSTREEHRRYFCIATPFGVFKMNAAPQGFCNTPGIFMDRMINEILGGVDSMNGVFAKEKAGCLQWLDDTLLYANTFNECLEVLERVLSNCVKWGLRLNVEKCDFVAREIIWCGRRISASGWNFRKEYFDKILEVPAPKTVKELEGVVYLATWLTTSIPDCCRLKDSMNELMMEIRRRLAKERGRK